MLDNVNIGTHAKKAVEELKALREACERIAIALEVKNTKKPASIYNYGGSNNLSAAIECGNCKQPITQFPHSCTIISGGEQGLGEGHLGD